MIGTHSIHQVTIRWNLIRPDTIQNPALVIIISDWSYGLLPYCGPGTREEAWRREQNFQEEISRYLIGKNIATLSLDLINPEGEIPDEEELIWASYIPELYITIKQVIAESGCSLQRSVLFGHGFGSRHICELSAYGIKPAGYIIAGGIYSDTETILTQKYLPFQGKGGDGTPDIQDLIPDPDTSLIVDNFGKILHAFRKEKGKIRLTQDEHKLVLFLPRELFSQDSSPEVLFSALQAPTLIIHGSGDLDVPVSNAFYLEQKLKQKNESVSRIVILDGDHWFREMPHRGEERIAERLSGRCIANQFDTRFFRNCQLFIEEVLKLGKHGRLPSIIGNKHEHIQSEAEMI
ncbi:MAG: prolyl oligopeptidase family serine peptidase [Methanospirillum sp.]|nr:prolyl oligopeptidase family serine peptidase [Methanospirillum sp.]